jgi:UDP-glucose 4-epimerase
MQIHVDRSIINPAETFKINLEGTTKILEFARMNDIKKYYLLQLVKFMEVLNTYPWMKNILYWPKHPYGVSKIAADRLCSSYNETYDLGVDIIRSFNLFGPRQKDSGYGGVIAIFIKKVLQNMSPIIYGDGTQTRDYMFIQTQ